jgi:hypothetical protein
LSRKIEKPEAIKDRHLTAVQDGIKALGSVSREIGDRHLTGQDERCQPSEQAQDHERASGQFQDRSEAKQAVDRLDARRCAYRKSEQLDDTMRQKEERKDDPRDG